MRWSRQMTVFRPIGDETDRLPGASLYPVTLSLADGAEGILITLAQLIADKRKLYRKLASLRVTLEESRLEYHPFIQSHNELLHATLRVALDRTALLHGIRM